MPEPVQRDLRDDRDEVDAVVAARPDLAALSNTELVEHVRSLMPLYRRLFERHINTSAACGVGIGTVAGVCDAIGRPDLVMTLVSGVGDVDSAAPSAALWQLSRLVAGSAALSAELDGGVEGLPVRGQAPFLAVRLGALEGEGEDPGGPLGVERGAGVIGLGGLGDGALAVVIGEEAGGDIPGGSPSGPSPGRRSTARRFLRARLGTMALPSGQSGRARSTRPMSRPP